MKIALTGGTGFIGGHIFNNTAGRGLEIKALARRPQPARPGVEWIRGPLEETAVLEKLVSSCQAVIHVAGAIKAENREAFEEINIGGTEKLIQATKNAGIRRFIYVSSLSAREPALSDYGWSKAQSEEKVKNSGLDWTIIRPPAVYGSGDREMLEMFRMAVLGIMIMPPKGRLSVISADDLSRLILDLVEGKNDEKSHHQLYEVDDGQPDGWSQNEFAQALGRAVGRPSLRIIHFSKSMLSVASRAEHWIRGKKSRLTKDRVRYFCHPDWVINAKLQPPPDLWKPTISLDEGLNTTAIWYRSRGWLKR
ncbi:MAG: NAD(P)-dependent oxidoreductase [Zymomonas mobilis subsp. pomaceae]|uniref:NAD-dependent epimerase/dehydratase n=1 Tax=Zymomonas mobilis subsp. pomaceae (strain ATCC 29192 / DSM 22645 / JCM 10191 / CCUG 17912 / NBRC 13757 / NCIMB 11200 / NRRL B-4491 / Barker I) TaxID=579138 RepID=F8EST1_ZYMMT|nr:NAD(P)-dependent oxidoreductase [Zymomonas mobilis]AEI37856.1 NAD-dependent epimerase/dehydratase [Zymomonas mobilis subsp. pomaceae ATCC 29192]MDX5949223.1 NAD(P)-dependent oxidoreductase [Zymomonas mobilis subsp. pomaceae]GEB89548.1 epimerase [Zymomonas mobilis subsp. pomaceae]